MGTPVEIVLSAFLVEKVGIELLRPQLSQMSHASLGTGHLLSKCGALISKMILIVGIFCYICIHKQPKIINILK